MKLEPQLVLELRCELEELITEREGMIAENQQRAFLGQAMAYCDDSFSDLGAKIKTLQETIVRLGEQ